MPETKPALSICIFDRRHPAVAEAVDSVYACLKEVPDTTYEFLVITDSQDFSFTLGDCEKAHPELKIVVMPVDVDRLAAFNYAIRKTSGDLLCLFNSDVILAPGFFVESAKYTDKLNLFSLSPVITLMKRRPGTAEYTPFPSRTLFEDGSYDIAVPGVSDKPSPVLFSWLGAAVYRRDILVSLNGFDHSYLSFGRAWCADLDICYRAWQAGYGSLYVPGMKLFLMEDPAGESIDLPAPRFMRYAGFFPKFVWNLNRLYFILRNKLPGKPLRFFGKHLIRLDFLTLATAFMSLVKSLFVRGREPDPRPVYDADKIRQITSRESL